MGEIITFYSYKGGTGRSMALANVAWLLAANGKQVLVIDWDLEAPGLHRYFKPFLADPELFETDGLIDAFWQIATRALTPDLSDRQNDSVDTRDLVSRPKSDLRYNIEWDFGSPRGLIDFIGAGRQGGTYSERVNTFDWKRFYSLGGGRWLNDFRPKFP